MTTGCTLQINFQHKFQQSLNQIVTSLDGIAEFEFSSSVLLEMITHVADVPRLEGYRPLPSKRAQKQETTVIN